MRIIQTVPYCAAFAPMETEAVTITIDDIRGRLYAMRDESYRDFQSKLIPTVDKTVIIGVRTPDLRAFAKEMFKSPEKAVFLEALPHTYFDEYQLHSFILSLEKDFTTCIHAAEQLLPYVDNWAVCDQMNPAVFKKHKEELLTHIARWLQSRHVYTVRFAIKMLMTHYLDDAFDPRYPAPVAAIRTDEYYVNMMRAWYFATALAKQYERVLPFLAEHRLDVWTHNKAIQKAVESRRLSPDAKRSLKALKRTDAEKNNTA